jgi:hypothetical protein
MARCNEMDSSLHHLFCGLADVGVAVQQWLRGSSYVLLLLS